MHGLILMSSNILAHVFLFLLFLLLFAIYFSLFCTHTHILILGGLFFLVFLSCSCHLVLVYECIIFSNSPEYDSYSYCVLFSVSWTFCYFLAVLSLGFFLLFFFKCCVLGLFSTPNNAGLTFICPCHVGHPNSSQMLVLLPQRKALKFFTQV